MEISQIAWLINYHTIIATKFQNEAKAVAYAILIGDHVAYLICGSIQALRKWSR